MVNENKVKRILFGFANWTYQKAKMLIIFLVILELYSVLHEYIHYLTNQLLGHSGKISWGLLAHHVKLDSLQMPFDHYFLIGVAPYLFDIALLAVVFSLYRFFPKYKAVLAKIGIFPFSDVLWNYLMMLPAYFTQASDDFLNMIKLGALKGSEAFLAVGIFIIILISVSIYLFKPFILPIWNMLKFDKAAKRWISKLEQES
ncbi:hypothetical protein HYV85_02830 [Candidatus Woesearchaeota archaeon]|nr:hypothetical protein [Candidatus Woesearchaeota archaeon]